MRRLFNRPPVQEAETDDDPLGIGHSVQGWHIKPTEERPIYPYLATYDGPDGRP
jgi:hypothetical protein